MSGFKLLTTQNFINVSEFRSQDDFLDKQIQMKIQREEELNSNVFQNTYNSNIHLKKETSIKREGCTDLNFSNEEYAEPNFFRRENNFLALNRENFRIINYKQPRNVEIIRCFFLLKGLEKSEERDLTCILDKKYL